MIPPVSGEGRHDLIALLQPQQAVVDKYAHQSVADRLVFIDASGTSVQRTLLKPEDERRVCARQAGLYALELALDNPFERRLRVGSRISGLPATARIPAGEGL